MGYRRRYFSSLFQIIDLNAGSSFSANSRFTYCYPATFLCVINKDLMRNFQNFAGIKLFFLRYSSIYKDLAVS